MDATPLLTDAETTRCRSCVDAPMHYVLDRADAQLEVSILGSYLRASHDRTMEALRRVTRDLLERSTIDYKMDQSLRETPESIDFIHSS